MSDLLTSSNSVTFTVTKMPRRTADRKTIARLMGMQPDIQKGMKALQKKRRQHDNNEYIRAGVLWNDRARATRLVRVEPGASFTLRLTPQMLPDLRSVERFLDPKKA